MKERKERKHLEARVSAFLWWGTLLSNLVILVGLLWSWKGTGYPPGRYPTQPSTIFQGILEGRPGAILSLGIAILLLIPVGRILFVGFGYLRRKEYALAGVSATVLLVLLVALLLGVSHT